jgi:hypothetical protein
MNGWRLIKTLRALGYVVVFVVGSLVFVGTEIYKEIAIEVECHRQFGPEWKQHYESHFGANSLAQAREKLTVGVVGMLVILTIMWFIYRSIVGRNERLYASSRRRRR